MACWTWKQRRILSVWIPPLTPLPTAHAVLAANANDGGNRRVINGHFLQGKQREELHCENLTFTKLKNAADLLAQVDSIKNLEGHPRRSRTGRI